MLLCLFAFVEACDFLPDLRLAAPSNKRYMILRHSCYAQCSLLRHSRCAHTSLPYTLMSTAYTVCISGESARVVYQQTSASSVISSSFLRTIRPLAILTHGHLNLSVSVPTTSGFFTSLTDFDVCEITTLVDGLSPPVDAILGRDWLGTCLSVASDGNMSFLATTGEYMF